MVATVTAFVTVGSSPQPHGLPVGKIVKGRAELPEIARARQTSRCSLARRLAKAYSQSRSRAGDRPAAGRASRGA
jgi:hypothetical protein